jgi:hypothetical protein
VRDRDRDRDRERERERDVGRNSNRVANAMNSQRLRRMVS